MSAIDRVFNRFRRSDSDTAEEPLSPFLAAGPVSLLVTLCLAMFHGGNLDLAIAVALGLVLSFSFALRGLLYSLSLLFLSALSKHLFFLDQHLWQMGIECSVAIGFMMCALASELVRYKEDALEAKLESQGRALGNLEEDAMRSREENLDEKIALQHRLEELQKEIDEIASESASLQILNDVLRKSALKKESAETEIADKEKRIAELLNEIEMQSSVSVPEATDLQEVNEKLLEELNMARVEREQTYLINETLVRMHSSASRKAKEQAEQYEQLSEQKDLLQQRLHELEAYRGLDVDAMELELQQARLKIAEVIDQRSVAIEAERNQWTENLSERDRMIALFQERVCELSETQALYFQLKKQFEEKSAILHQTRKELFRTETALQAAQLEQKWEEMEFPLFETILSSEVTVLESEMLSLETENAELSAIIGLLSKPVKVVGTLAPKKRKTSKKKSS
jgi:hypothetical protein